MSPNRPPPKPNRPPAIEARPGETGEPNALRRRQDTLPGTGPVPPEHLAAARAAAREPHAELEPSLPPEQLQLALYRKRAEEAEARARTVSQAPGAILDDAAVGKLVKASVNALVKRIGIPAALLASLAGGGGLYKYATDKPAPPPLTAAELDKALKPFATRLDKLTTTTNEVVQLSKCTRRKVNQIGGALLPDPQKMGTALKPQPYEDDCPDNPKPLPEPD